MTFYLVMVGLLAVLVAFDKKSRKDLVKPEHSTFKVLAYIGMYLAVDKIWGLPLRGYGVLEIVGAVTITTVVMLPVLLFGEHYTNKWWTTRRQPDRVE
jgi:putative Mn2+ efflux pump MntP